MARESAAYQAVSGMPRGRGSASMARTTSAMVGPAVSPLASCSFRPPQPTSRAGLQTGLQPVRSAALMTPPMPWMSRTSVAAMSPV